MAIRGVAWLRHCSRLFCDRWALLRHARLWNSSSSIEKVAEVAETKNGEAARHRWKELPPVPLESAVRALEAIESYNEGSEMRREDRMKQLTALRWVAKCCPNVPNSLINKLFRLRQIRMQVLEEISSHAIRSSKDTRLIRVSAKDTLEEGAVLCIPTAVSVTLDERIPATNAQKPTAQDVKWLRSLILHKGGSEVVRSLDSMMGAALSYDYDEGPRLVHRLDKETSGALVVGRTHQSTVFLQALLRDKTAKLSGAPGGKVSTMERCYWALVIGVPEAKEGRISAPLAKVVTDSGKLDKMRVVHDSHPKALEAITDYKVLGSSVLGCSWLELRPLTGRKHQIRVHCAEVLGMPIVGDYKYGWRALQSWPPDGHSENTTIAKESGHVWSSRPNLHLHCRQLSLPDVALAFQRQPGEERPLGTTIAGSRLEESLDIVAPLPPHGGELECETSGWFSYDLIIFLSCSYRNDMECCNFLYNILNKRNF